MNPSDWRGRAKTYGLAHPQLSGELPAAAQDPSVEALLDGVDVLLDQLKLEAMLASTHHEEDWATALVPWLQRPYPSFVNMAFANFTPGARHQLPWGTQVNSEPVDGVPVQFRTLQPLTVTSLTLGDAHVEENVRGQQSLVFMLRSPEPLRTLPLDALLLHVVGSQECASSLVSWLCRHCAEVQVESPSASPQRLPVPAFARLELGSDLPVEGGPPSGLEPMQRYFHAPQTLHYVRMHGLPALLAQLPETYEIRVRVRFDEPLPARVRVEPETLRLHCTPAVNLVWTPGESVALDPVRPEALVRVPDMPPWAAVPYALMQVRIHGRHGPVLSEPQQRTGLSENEPAVRWALRWRPGASGDVDAWLRFEVHPAAMRLAPTLVVSTQMWATQRGLAARLRPGEVRDTGALADFGLRAMNLDVPSPYVPSPWGMGLADRLTAMLRLNASPHDALQTLLCELNIPENAAPNLHEANRARILALLAAEVKPFWGALADHSEVSGYHTKLVVDEAPFQGLGDLDAFGSALLSTLKSLASAGHASLLSFHLQRAETELSWTHPATLLKPSA